jgi:hypothetical protein
VSPLPLRGLGAGRTHQNSETLVFQVFRRQKIIIFGFGQVDDAKSIKSYENSGFCRFLSDKTRDYSKLMR